MLQNKAQIGGFCCLLNKVSEFLYKAVDKATGFAIKKANFMKCMNSKIGKYLVPQLKSEYKRQIRDILIAHREIEAKKMDNRMDHIDL